MKLLMLMDDEPYVRRVLELQIKEHCGEVEVVAPNTSVEGLEYLGEHRVDVLVLDINMPTVDGFEFINVIKKQELNAKTPIVVLSAVGNDKVKELMKEVGVKDYFEKIEIVEAGPMRDKFMKTLCELMGSV